MLTIFSMPKAFRGLIGVIQRNAIRSWTLLSPKPEIILLGTDEGTQEIAGELGLRHLPNVARNGRGTPLVNDLFRQAQQESRFELMCYVNADIVLLSTFARSVETVSRAFSRFLLVSQRINLDVPEAINLDGTWEASMKTRCRTSGAEGDHTAIDVFVFPKGMYADMPEFYLGRLWFDQWLIKAARQAGLPVIDASRVAPVIHQNHDYNHVAGGQEAIWRGKEAEHNFGLYGGVEHAFTLLDSTHELTGGGRVRRVWLRRPRFTIRQAAWDLFVRRTISARDTLKLRRKFWQAKSGKVSC